MSKTKQPWVTPELIAMTRAGDGQEFVLSNCKQLAYAPGYPNSNYGGCFQNGLFCDDCSSRTGS